MLKIKLGSMQIVRGKFEILYYNQNTDKHYQHLCNAQHLYESGFKAFKNKIKLLKEQMETGNTH